MSSPEYYYTSTLEFTDQIDNAAVGAASNAFFQALSELITNANAGTKLISFVVFSAGGAATTVQYEAQFDGDGRIVIDDVFYDAAAVGFVTYLITRALGIQGLQAVGVAAFTGGAAEAEVLHSNLISPISGFFEALVEGNFDAELQLKDSSGKVLSGAIYDDGIPTNLSQEVSNLLNGLGETGDPGEGIVPTTGMVVELHSDSQYGAVDTFKIYDGDIAMRAAEIFFGGDIENFKIYPGGIDSGIENGRFYSESTIGGEVHRWLVARDYDPNDPLNLGPEDFLTFPSYSGIGGGDFHVSQIAYAQDGVFQNGDNALIFLGDHNASFAVGNEENNLMYGGGGIDTIWGHGGDDIIYGDFGSVASDISLSQTYADDDTIIGGSGEDQLFGGGGNDIFVATAYDADNYINGGSESAYTSTQLNKGLNQSAIFNEDDVRGDTVDYSVVSSSVYGIQANLNNFSSVITSDGGGQVTIGANTANVMVSETVVSYTDTLIDIENVWGTDGSDLIIGNDKNNVFRSNGGSDVFEGRGGTDYFYVELPQGNHYAMLDGGAGRDYFYITGSADEYQKGALGDDVIYTRMAGGSVTLRNYDPEEDVLIFNETQIIEVESSTSMTATYPLLGPKVDVRIPDGDSISNPPSVDNDGSAINIQFVTDHLGVVLDFVCGFPVLHETIMYVDGVPVIWIGEDGDIVFYPENAGVIAGFKADGTETDIFTSDTADYFVGGRPAVVLPDDDVYTTYVTATSEWSNTALYPARSNIESTGSPLVVDLDMDGQIELVSLANTQTYWDIDGDSFAEASGWVSADDGLLAIDLNGDGVIDSHDELFGSLTTDGFTELAVLDSNSDGVIDTLDTQFTDLLIWQDVNQNGISGAAELHSLADFNITSINLNATTPTNLYIEGHNISHVSSFTVDDGVNPATTHEIVDAWFEYDNINTLYNDAFVLDSRTLGLPNLRGYGNVATLQIAASIDNDETDPNSLMSLLNEFSEQEFSSVFTNESIFDDLTTLIYRWTGVDDVDPSARGASVDARKLVALENLIGDDIKGVYDLGPLQGEMTYKHFDLVLYSVAARLIGQLVSDDLFEGDVSYNAATDMFEGITGLNQTGLNALLAQSLDGEQVGDKVAYWSGVINVIDQIVGIDNLSGSDLAALGSVLASSDPSLSVQKIQNKIFDTIESNLSWASVAGDYIIGSNGDDVYGGTIGDDVYYATYGNDTISGDIGDDYLTGGHGNDILIGGLGDDYLSGDGNDDIYHFSLGHGNDSINDTNGVDKIVFDQGLTASDLILDRIADGLLITIDPAVGSGSILILSQFFGYGSIETLEFSDSSLIQLNNTDFVFNGNDQDEIINGVSGGYGGSGVDTIYGNGGNDTIYGAGINSYSYTEQNYLYGGTGDDIIRGDHGEDELYGEDGNDDLRGNGGADLIVGGLGDDILDGGSEADTYIYNLGDGHDTVSDIYATAQTNKIVFGSGITANDLSFSRSGAVGFVITLDPALGSGSITITNQFQNYGAISLLEFDDGSTIDLYGLDHTLVGTEASETLTGINSASFSGTQADTLYGLGGNDTLYGYAGDDLLDGGDGNDVLRGYQGNDVYVMGLGNDYVVETLSGDDTFVYSGGLDTIYHTGGGDDRLILDIDTTINDISFVVSGHNHNLVIDAGVNEVELQYFLYNASYTTETIEFQDGFVTSLASYQSWINGTSANDTLTGTASDDTIIGKDGDDVLTGDAGDDDIHGGAGNDTLYGGDGTDDLWGGAGSDTFIFEAASAFNNVDTVGDFSVFANDVIDISDLLVGYDSLNDAITDFVQISYDGTDSSIYVDADGGADNFIQIAQVNDIALANPDTLETYGYLIAA